MHRDQPVREDGAARAPTLRVERLRVTLGAREIIRGVGFEAGAGELVGLIGPNGSGKTTLLRALAGLVPSSGTLTLGTRAVARMPRRDLARGVSLMAQHPPADFTFTAAEVVGLGRLPHLPLLGTAGAHDRALVQDALARVGAEAFGARPLRELSGGERRRVMMAQTLAQDAPVVLLDEPTAHLDVSHQYALLAIARQLADAGRLVVAALHEIPLAARFCTRLLALKAGQIVADGPPGDVLSPALFAGVFGMQAEVRVGPAGPEIRYLQPLPPSSSPPAP